MFKLLKSNHGISLSSTTPTVQSPTVLDLTELRQGPDISSALIAKKGELLPLSNYGLIVESVLFTKILATGNPNEYKGFFEIQFASSSLALPVKPVLYQQIFKTVATDWRHWHLSRNAKSNITQYRF